MCDQCLAKTNMFNNDKEVLSGFYLVQATQDGGSFKEGNYGLVIENDPSFVFSVKPERCPDPKYPEDISEEIEGEDTSAYWDWIDKAEQFKQDLYGTAHSLKDSYYLIKACYDAGYKDEYGCVEQWLFNYLAQFVN